MDSEMTMAIRLTMKLMINSETNEVLFAEASKEAVDVILSIMALPMATAVRMVQGPSMKGSLGNIVQSIENLDDKYVQPGQSAKALLQPTRASTPLNRLLLFQSEGDDEPDDRANDEDYNGEVEDEDDEMETDYDDEVEEDGSTEALFVKCPVCPNSGYAVDKRAICPTCSGHMTSEMQFVPYAPSVTGPTEVGWVNGLTRYMVMDDLVVKPMAAISTVAVLKDLNIKDITLLQEKEVYLGLKEALMLLNTSFHSKKVLTEVFINNPCKAPEPVVKTGSS